VRRFLIARLSSLGDVVCSLPAATALKAGHPGCEVTWVVDPRFAGIVERCASVDRVVAWKPSLRSIPRWDEPFDAALDLQGLGKSGLAIWRAKAPVKLGYHWRREGAWLFSSRVLPDPTSHHVVDQYVDVARAAGGTADFADFALRPTEEDVLSVRRKLKERGVVGRFVVVNPGSAWATKRWPPASFGARIDRLDLPCVLIGGTAAADRQGADEVLAAASVRPADLLGQTNMGELIALLRLASLHIGGDTGSSHIAAAVGTPAVGLYSITRPARSCPYGGIDLCLYDPKGLASISVEAVAERASAALA
jgi:heptosyltransferase I